MGADGTGTARLASRLVKTATISRPIALRQTELAAHQRGTADDHDGNRIQRHQGADICLAPRLIWPFSRPRMMV
jgi:hypothetical protein